MRFEFLQTNKQLFSKLVISFGFYLIALIGFVIIAKEVRDGATLGVDRGVLLAINHQSTPMLDHFFIVFTNFADVKLIGLISCMLLVYLIYKKQYHKAVLTAFAMGGTAVFIVTLKLLFERVRPELWQRLITENSFSFPSGHAMGSSALALTIIALLWHTKWRILAICTSSIYVILIGLSRLYLGVHYPTDVLAGWLVSIVWVVTVAGVVYAWLLRRHYESTVILKGE